MSLIDIEQFRVEIKNKKTPTQKVGEKIITQYAVGGYDMNIIHYSSAKRLQYSLFIKKSRNRTNE